MKFPLPIIQKAYLAMAILYDNDAAITYIFILYFLPFLYTMFIQCQIICIVTIHFIYYCCYCYKYNIVPNIRFSIFHEFQMTLNLHTSYKS